MPYQKCELITRNTKAEMNMVNIPALIITYNRFDFVLHILQMFKKYDLKQVYISIDDYPRDKHGFEEIEQYLTQNNFSFDILKWESNVGMERNIVEGSKWFFSKVNRGIVIEDDCRPVESFFSFLRHLNDSCLKKKSISFFSTNLEEPGSFFLKYSYIPFFWGWYSSKEEFDHFFEFYMTNKITLKQLRSFFKSDLDLRIKLICLMNYLAFDHGDINTPCSWDSAFLYYQIFYRKPFLVPSFSLINNTGFEGDERSTHTIVAPSWYKKIKLASSSVDEEKISVFLQNEKKDSIFLHRFYDYYPHNKFRLIYSICKNYLRYIIRNK